MSQALSENQLLGLRAHGEPCGRARLKAVAEDFQVDEVLDIPLAGDGEHLWLWVEKRNLNTEEAARRIARQPPSPIRFPPTATIPSRRLCGRRISNAL